MLPLMCLLIGSMDECHRCGSACQIDHDKLEQTVEIVVIDRERTIHISLAQREIRVEEDTARQ